MGDSQGGGKGGMMVDVRNWVQEPGVDYEQNCVQVADLCQSQKYLRNQSVV